jgi:2'-5' RNA ligase
MRTFIAIELPDHVKKSMGQLSERLKNAKVAASWTRPEQIHLTLRFLGDVDEPRIEILTGMLREEYKGLKPFKLFVAGAGAFPNAHRPNVIWAGLRGVPEALQQAQSIAETAARAIGLPPENRPFKPHLTLARVREPSSAGSLAGFLEKERDFDAGGFNVGSVTLFSSQLSPKGATHTRIEEFSFDRNQPD